MTKLHKTTTAFLLAAALLFSGCTEQRNSPAQGVGMTNSTESTSEISSADPESSENSLSESESANSSDNSSGSDDYNLDPGLKGDELIAKFKWPCEDPISTEGMNAQRIITPLHGFDEYVDIPLSELSNEFMWHVICDYGCLAMTPENGEEYVYKKYKAGDRIGDFTVHYIQISFNNVDHFEGYIAGAWADFRGEAVLTGEMMIDTDEFLGSELIFYPDEESRKKLPVVNFVPKLSDHLGFWDNYDNLIIGLKDRTDHPEIDFSDIPEDGTRVNVKFKIDYYGYGVQNGYTSKGFANIVDGSFEVL